jgi:hypothetical protein
VLEVLRLQGALYSSGSSPPGGKHPAGCRHSVQPRALHDLALLPFTRPRRLGAKADDDRVRQQVKLGL